MVPQLWSGRKVIMVLLIAPRWLFSKTIFTKIYTIMTFLQTSTFVTFLFFLKSAPIWLIFRTKLRHHYDFSIFLGQKLQKQFLGWKNAQIPQLIDSDGRALHKDSESGPNSKITKITNMTFLQNPAEVPFLLVWIPFWRRPNRWRRVTDPLAGRPPTSV